jgi:hypothetical protein
VGVLIWKLLDGRHSLEDIEKELRKAADEVPDEAGEHLNEFIQELVQKGLAGFELQKNGEAVTRTIEMEEWSGGILE